MRKFGIALTFAALFLIFANVFSASLIQSSQGENQVVVINQPGYFNLDTVRSVEPSEKISRFDIVAPNHGFALTPNKLFRTNDAGRSWQEIVLPKNSEQAIAAISFADEKSGWLVLANAKASLLELVRTEDGGATWAKRDLELPAEILAEADLNRMSVAFSDSRSGKLAIRLPSSSNFTRAAVFRTGDAGETWRLERAFMEPSEFSLEFLTASSENHQVEARVNNKEVRFLSRNAADVSFVAPLSPDESVTAIDFADKRNGWILAEAGRCRNFKSECEQSARLLATADAGKTWRDATPEAARGTIKIANSSFANRAGAAPDGQTRVSMSLGFDKCAAGTLPEMQAWWNSSPFFDSNVYIGGANHNRSCSNTQSAYLNSNWINQTTTMGWGLIPTWVGPQAPCSSSTTSSKHSSDPATAETEGRAQADAAIAAANNLGMTTGSVIYYDMERYDDVSGTGACSAPVKSFLKGWTDRMKERGYVSGVYGSPTNAMGDWINIPAASRMDAVWLARYDNVPSVWQYNAPSPAVPVQFWGQHQRIKQWQGGHNETWGGVTLNIDSNISDGPVAGVRAATHKPSDFDGDGKTDIAVYRPENGAWYVLYSSNNSFVALGFGGATDIIAPGDFDNDGRTDYSVFRPENGTWYENSYNPARPAATAFRFRQFGQAGDVPVTADYDGDGNADLAVFRAGNWYITPSLDPRDPNFRAVQFGAADDLPVPADYDGDGRADIAVFRPSNGTWYLLRSSAGYTAAQFGQAGDRPAQGDYDGDGKADLVVFRPSNGVWYLLQTTNGFTGTQFGQAGDRPVPGDYDGDNKWDIGVFRPANGAWYLLTSANGFRAVQFGAGTDRPVPSAYVPREN